MKFRIFEKDGKKIAVNVDCVAYCGVVDGKTRLYLSAIEEYIIVDEDFDTVFSRLNTIAE